MKKKIHLVAFNVPYPANYGGVIDVFYKIKALKSIDVAVILHCFQYGRTTSEQLGMLCEKVYYYPRKTDIFQHFSFLPYIVQSRKNTALLQNLKQDDAPVLFEGLHCAGFLNHFILKNRIKLLRMHNIEWQYYAHLANLEQHFFKKIFFKIESLKLKYFEKIAKNATEILSISTQDTVYFRQKFPTTPVLYVPAFHANDSVISITGQGDYALFHGDLSVKDNEQAAFSLIMAFQNSPHRLVIAGLNPSEMLIKTAALFQNITLKANVSEEKMTNLIQNAHVNILISFHSAGMKLKLLNALFQGRFVVANPPIVENTGLEALCTVIDSLENGVSIIDSIFKQTFDEKIIEKRKILLNDILGNQKNAILIKNCIKNSK